mmetsp:Transcript_105012/g.323922  ORF Transcript_105012/g.323922 Transcript_105012/m.323922 type:complete len:264 (+) Transcript_105012:253-1044(+)
MPTTARRPAATCLGSRAARTQACSSPRWTTATALTTCWTRARATQSWRSCGASGRPPAGAGAVRGAAPPPRVRRRRATRRCLARCRKLALGPPRAPPPAGSPQRLRARSSWLRSSSRRGRGPGPRRSWGTGRSARASRRLRSDPRRRPARPPASAARSPCAPRAARGRRRSGATSTRRRGPCSPRTAHPPQLRMPASEARRGAQPRACGAGRPRSRRPLYSSSSGGRAPAARPTRAHPLQRARPWALPRLAVAWRHVGTLVAG